MVLKHIHAYTHLSDTKDKSEQKIEQNIQIIIYLKVIEIENFYREIKINKLK